MDRNDAVDDGAAPDDPRRNWVGLRPGPVIESRREMGAGLPDAGHAPGALFESSTWVDSPHWDVEAVHDVLRRWRTIGDEYDGDRLFVTEAVVNGPERLSRYVRPDEMHMTFNFDYLRSPWDAGALRAVCHDAPARRF